MPRLTAESASNDAHAAQSVPARLVAEWPPDQWRSVHVLVAVSGGADSMALLRALVDAKQQAGGSGRLFAGHVNHLLRGDAADADAAWLREQCERLGVPLSVERADAAKLAAAQGNGLEAAARRLRYDALTRMAEDVGARFVAVAHTHDDQVETVLFRLLRGTGVRGLAGMPATRPLAPSVSLVRPLLGCSRADLRSYLSAIDQPFRRDSSNDDPRFARNRVRNELLPLLRERFGAGVDNAISRLAEQAGGMQAAVDSLAGELLARCRIGGLEIAPAPMLAVMLATPPLADRPEPLVCEVLRRAWREAGWPEGDMTREWWIRLARLAQGASDRPLNLPGNIRATRPSPGVLALTPQRLP